MTRRWRRVSGIVRRALAGIGTAGALVAAGVVAGALQPEAFSAMVRSLAELDLPEQHGWRALRIFLHNLVASYLAVWLGRAWGIFPALAAFLNGAVAGAVLSLAIPQLPARDLLLATVPHGVFEIPAALLALGLGLWNGGAAFPGTGRTARRRRWARSNSAFLHVVVPLLLVAAVIEGR